MKTYTLRVELQIEASSDEDAKRKGQLFVKELPRLEEAYILKASLYSVNEKKIIDSNVR
jgi:hypothetical protein